MMLHFVFLSKNEQTVAYAELRKFWYFPTYQRRTNRMHSTDTSTVLPVTLCCGKTLPTEPSCKRQMFPRLWREAKRDPPPREPEGREHPKRSRMSWRRKRKPGRSGKPWSTQFSCSKPSKILHEISINVHQRRVQVNWVDICFVCSRLMVKELDPWFQTRTSQLDETVKRLTQIKKTLSVMSSYKVHYSFYRLTFVKPVNRKFMYWGSCGDHKSIDDFFNALRRDY